MGQHNGGEGVVRDIEFRIPVQVSILSERRAYRPYGLHGGQDAQCGKNIWVRRIRKGGQNGKTEEEVERYVSLGGKNTASMKAGERVIVFTPGGGGYGEPGKEKQIQRKKDHEERWKKGSLAARIAMQESSV